MSHAVFLFIHTRQHLGYTTCASLEHKYLAVDYSLIIGLAFGMYRYLGRRPGLLGICRFVAHNARLYHAHVGSYTCRFLYIRPSLGNFPAIFVAYFVLPRVATKPRPHGS